MSDPVEAPLPLDAFEHRVLWLGRVRLGIQRLLTARGRVTPGQVAPPFKPTWHDEVTHALTGLAASGEVLDHLDAEMRRYDLELVRRLEHTRALRGEAPGDALRKRLGLDFDGECLLWALAAPQIDAAATRLYRLAEGLERRGVPLDFAAAVALGVRHRDLDRAGALLDPAAPLLRLRLIISADDAANRDLDLASLARAHPSIVRFLGDGGAPDGGGLVSISQPSAERLWFSTEFEAGLASCVRQASDAAQSAGAFRVWLIGPRGAGKRALGRRLVSGLGRAHWVIDAAAIAPATGLASLCDLFREARLAGAVLHVHDADRWFDKAAYDPAFARLLLALVADHALPILFDSSVAPESVEAFPFVHWLRVPAPSVEDRRRMWARALGDATPDATLADLAQRYLLTGGQIQRAARRALGDTTRSAPSFSEVAVHARAEQTTGLGALAQRVEHRLAWDDLVLPDAIARQVQDVLGYARLRLRIFDDWGFHRKITYGRGLTMLFSGPPGTGKTMLAGIIAGELGLDLYRLDLSQVTSKYIGETEKQLDRVFEHAEQTQSALLFDEADSMFATRTAVKSSNDRYANLEVNYLLQRIESFDGVSILTTNAKQSLDEALLRRIRFKIELPAPTALERERLWQSMLPAEAPTEGDLGLGALAREHEMSGADIKNAVVRAAIQAAMAGVAIGAEHLRDAAEAMSHEAGRLVRRRP